MKPLRSRLYDCEVIHSRRAPVQHRFSYRYFTFCLDLDEIELLSKKFAFFGTKSFKPFRFVPTDSLFGSNCQKSGELKNSIVDFAKRMGIQAPIARVEWVAHVRTFGYSYNPAAFYFGYDLNDRLLFGIVEVTNTFHEKKVYFIPASCSKEDEASGTQPKLFYVSPFIELDTHFEFTLKRPNEKLFVQIDSRKDGSSIVLHALLTGKSRTISNFRLFYYLMRYPFITLSVMAKIHFQAAGLYLKRVPFIKKTDRPELQKGGLP